jgi:hypothetical protein
VPRGCRSDSVDARCTEARLTADEWLAEHREHSAPVMERLLAFMTEEPAESARRASAFTNAVSESFKLERQRSRRFAEQQSKRRASA